MQRFPLKFTSLHTQTQSRINLEPYKIASSPYAAPTYQHPISSGQIKLFQNKKYIKLK